MDRALRNPLVVAANPTNAKSGYQGLSNAQLAQEVQKFSGYNHFSSSGANLLEEVVRRLSIAPNGDEFLFGQRADINPDTRPVSFGSTITENDLVQVRAKVMLDVNTVLHKNRYVEIEKLLEPQVGAQAKELVVEFKKSYNLSSIITSQGSDDRVLVIFWLQPNRPAQMGIEANVYWRWESGLIPEV